MSPNILALLWLVPIWHRMNWQQMRTNYRLTHMCSIDRSSRVCQLHAYVFLFRLGMLKRKEHVIGANQIDTYRLTVRHVYSAKGYVERQLHDFGHHAFY